MSIIQVLGDAIERYTYPIDNIKVSITHPDTIDQANRSGFFASFFNLPPEKKLDFLRQYQTDIWVYICVNRIAQSSSRIPVKILKRRTRSGTKGFTKGERDLIVNHKHANLGQHDLSMDCYVSTKFISKLPLDLLYKLDMIEEVTDSDLGNLFNRPNPTVTKYHLLEGSISFLELRGDSYLEMVGERDEPISERNPPVELWHLNPDKITIVPDKEDFVAGYVFDAGRVRIPIPKENIIHIKYFNPLNLYYGQGTIEALTSTITLRKNSDMFQHKFYKQGMKPSGILTSPEVMSKPQYDRLNAEIQTNYGGVQNMHKPLLLDGGLEWQNMTVSQRDAEFIKLRVMEREDYLAAFGVPPILVGLPTENFATAKESKVTYYQDTVQPKVQLHEEKFNNELAPLFGPDLFIKYDFSDTPIGQQDKEKLTGALKDAFTNSVLSRNEYRKNLFKLGIDINDEIDLGPEGDQFFIPMNLMPVEDINNDDALSEQDDDEDE